MDTESEIENDDNLSSKISRSHKRIYEKDEDEAQSETPKKLPRLEHKGDFDFKKYQDIFENIRKRKKELQCRTNSSHNSLENECTSQRPLLKQTEGFKKYQEICENIYKRKKELRLRTDLKQNNFKNERRLRRQLKQREDLISCLEQRIAELEGHNKDFTELTSSSHLLEYIRKLEKENEEMRIKIIETETKLNIYMQDCKKFESPFSNKTSLGLTVFDGQVVPAVLGTDSDISKMKSLFIETEKKLKQLQSDKDVLQLKLSESEKKRMENEKHFQEEKDRLENDFFNEHIKFTEHLANTPSLIVIENNIKRQVDVELVDHLQKKLQCLASSYETVKKLLTDFSMSVKDDMNKTTLRIQNAIKEVDSKNKELVHRYTNEVHLRKLYHNQLVELRGNIRVYCRVRPPIKEDESTDSVLSFDHYDNGIINVNAKGRCQQFHFDKVFSMQASQTQVFEEVRSRVRSAIDGFHVCIFAYGQTGSGKTYTMEGTATDPGVNQRALRYLFEEAQNTVWQYEIEASMLEIYNETIRDLLDAEDDDKNKLEIKMKPEGGLYVPGLLTVSVKSLDEVNELFENGRRNRSTAETCMNERSSRSHCLFLLSIVGVNTITGDKIYGRLNLIDLAGSERASKTQVEGARLQEAKHINKSLSCLGDVINALKNKHTHIPYRNSKLTYLLQESLGGDSKTLMILQISPVEKNVNESIFTLNFGQRGMSAELGAATKKVEDGKDRFVYESEGSSVHGPGIKTDKNIKSAIRFHEGPPIKKLLGVRWDVKGTPSSARRPNTDTPKSPGISLTPSNRTPNLPKTASVPSKLSLRYK